MIGAAPKKGAEHMTGPKHTPGPVYSTGATIETKKGEMLAIVQSLGGNYEGNARLLAAAYTSYDKHCGPRAVECAEGDLLGELLAICKEVRPDYEHNMIKRLRAVIARYNLLEGAFT